jgi:hypothetical protein
VALVVVERIDGSKKFHAEFLSSGREDRRRLARRR